MKSKYGYRTFIKVIIEAETPLKIGAGTKGVITDAEIALDSNGLPYIPGTAIAGVIRHAFSQEQKDGFFGSVTENVGSEIIFSDAKLVYEGNKIADGIVANRTEYLQIFADLPVRQHVCINHTGAAKEGGKFDETVIFSGTRFCFEAELVSEIPGKDTMMKILTVLAAKHFRMGGGTRKGFGKMKVVQAQIADLNLAKSEDLQLYLNKDSNLNFVWNRWEIVSDITPSETSGWTTRILTLEPEDFFLFSSGFGDNEADNTPVFETSIRWTEGNPATHLRRTLIPGSSVKGALSHRVAFHYNRLTHKFADKQKKNDLESLCGADNDAVNALFGDTESCGNVIISDIFIDAGQKNFTHNSLDDFTGGTFTGHLFTEKVSVKKDGCFKLEISVKESAFGSDPDKPIKKALNCALKDLCQGNLPLGGGVNKGNGRFIGTIDEEF